MTALTLVDRRSFDDLSLSALASELGLRPSALYTYFDGLDGLRHAVAVQATRNLTEVVRDAAVGRSGDDAVAAMASAYRRFAVDHPGQYASTLLLPSQPGDDLAETVERLTDVFARVIAGYGHDEDRTLHVARAVRSAVHGFVALEICRGFHPTVDHDESFEHLVDTILNGVR